MATTPFTNTDENLAESWVDLSQSATVTPDRVTPLSFVSVTNSDVQKLLWEAQKDPSGQSGVTRFSSGILSRATSSRATPKSPPNSPNTELNLNNCDELTNLYINRPEFIQERGDLSTYLGKRAEDWVWDWSSRPDATPPKEWKFDHPRGSKLSMRTSKAVKSGLLSTEVLTVVIITNLVSILIGAGIGYCIGKKMAAFSELAAY